MHIKRILAANRGEIVSRVARTAHRRGIEVIAVYAASDANAHYLRDADAAFYLGDDSNSSPYLDIDLLVKAARVTECDSVHPGFGFLAENATFARAVIAAGLIWIGPPPEAIDAMGGKVAAKKIAAEAGVSILESIELTEDVEAAGAAARKHLSPPLLVKPSAGGGGKGMHRVDDMDQLTQVLTAAQREAKASFGDGTLFIERYLETARHVEVQVMADSHGNVIHAGTRDCSVQRRHQKIVEEAPAPYLSTQLRDEMCESSVNLARRIGYVGAGTVEFMVFGEEYAFLEMNTRLQVEHPVTEEVTGLDLVDLQIVVAGGEALPVEQSDIEIRGHAMEVRLYAEDPAAGFLPSPGVVDVFEAPLHDEARWEVGVAAGSRVSPRYDPMIAKIITSGRDRGEARSRLIRSLRGLAISGVKTNRDMLVAVLENEDFTEGRLATRFLDDNPGLAFARPSAQTVRTNVIAAVLEGVKERRRLAGVQTFAPAGWRSLRSADSLAAVSADGDDFSVGYVHRRDGTWGITIDGDSYEVWELPSEAGSTDLLVGDVRRRVTVRRTPTGYLASSNGGHTFVSDRSRLASVTQLALGALISPLPGVVVAIERKEGDQIAAGETLMVVEAMKMEHRVTAPESGVVTAIHVKVGDTVEHDQLLAAVGGSDEA